MNNEQDREINRKRKTSHDPLLHLSTNNNNSSDDPLLNLSTTNNNNSSHDPLLILSTNNNNFTGSEDQDVNELQLSLSPPSRPTRLRLEHQPPPPPLQQEPPPMNPPPTQHLLFSQPPLESPLQLSYAHEIYRQPPPPHLNPQPQPRPRPQTPPPQAVVQPVPPPTNPQPQPRPHPQPPPPPQAVVQPVPGPSRRARRNPTQAPSDVIPPPFPWATEYRATVHSVSHLLSQQISSISGLVQCKRCEKQYEIEYDLEEKFAEVASFISRNRHKLHDRAPIPWLHPILPTCRFCQQENSAKPVIADSKKSINWLFLLLGQMLGCCTLEQLKYFCKHTKNHRTGAKDRVLYLTYLALCKQLDPNGPFERL